MRLVIVSGRSGSGKSVSLHVLEDMGFYCVDNLPMTLIPALLSQMHARVDQVAIGIDARNVSSNLDELQEVLDTLSGQVDRCEVLFLNADEETLLKRFSETRRSHPLTKSGMPLAEAIKLEQKLLSPIAMRADLWIDTSRLTMHDLRDYIHQRLELTPSNGMSLLFKSFGYKFGAVTDADYVFDVRCLPNPYWHAGLRDFSGKEQNVKEFLGSQAEVATMLTDIQSFLDNWLTRFEKNGRKYMTIAVGCTGGLHRSVYIVECLTEIYKSNWPVQVRHRELS